MTEPLETGQHRRDFLRLTAGAGLLTFCPGQKSVIFAAETNRRSLDGLVGLTTGGGLGKKRQRGEITLMTLPKYMCDELGMPLIDLNTRWIESYETDYLKQARTAAEAAGCFFTNLKVNHGFGDLYSKDSAERMKALAEGRKLIDTAKILGTRWIRFSIPKTAVANPIAHRELAAYAKPQGIQLLAENGGWLAKDANSIISVVKAIGVNVAPCPDTGNWDDDVRDQGLRNSFPSAASCDFKVFEMTANRQHPKYDLKHCFDIGWEAGFRGPWVIENMHDSDKTFASDTVYIRDLLKKWIAAAQAK